MIKKCILLTTAAALLLSCLSACAQNEQTQTVPGTETIQSSSMPIESTTQESEPQETTSLEPVPTETDEQTVPNLTGSAEIIQQMESSYEEFLSAAVLVGLSMQYPDFELDSIRFAEKHASEDKMQSEGVYAFFRSGGTAYCIYAAPLGNPRTESGTVDLYEESLGYATFDLSQTSVDSLTGYQSVGYEDLTEQIGQMLLVTIIEN